MTVPIIFIVFAAIAVAAGFVTAFTVYYTMRSKVLEAERRANHAVPFKDSELVNNHKHGLKSLWQNSGTWNWRCECGRGGKLVYTGSGALPTEERAILRWRAHVETHERLVLPSNELSHQACDARFVGLWSLFDKWRTACYCQSTSNDLILLNQEVKKFVPKTEEKSVQLES